MDWGKGAFKDFCNKLMDGNYMTLSFEPFCQQSNCANSLLCVGVTNGVTRLDRLKIHFLLCYNSHCCSVT